MFDDLIHEIEDCKDASALTMIAWAARDRIQALSEPLQDLVCRALNERMDELLAAGGSR